MAHEADDFPRFTHFYYGDDGDVPWRIVDDCWIMREYMIVVLQRNSSPSMGFQYLWVSHIADGHTKYQHTATEYIQHSSTTYIDLPRSIDLRDGQWKKTVRKLQAFLIGGLEHLFPIYWECHNPNWRTHIFSEG